MAAGDAAIRQPRSHTVASATVDTLARWLLLVVAIDLVVTRLLVRLAIVIPKGEPFASGAAVIGRIGAVADALVPIVGLLLLGALLLRAGGAGRAWDMAMLVGITIVAFTGLALTVLPPREPVVVTVAWLVAAIAVVAAVRTALNPSVPGLARLGLVTLATAVVSAAVTTALGSALMPLVPGSALNVVGQVAFVLGAGLVGLGGFVAGGRPGAGGAWLPGRRVVAAAAVVALAVVASSAAEPAMWSALTIWSTGLSGVVPAAALALAVGLAISGLPQLHRHAPWAALGGAIVLLAGFGQASSGLVLAGLLGLVLPAGRRD